MGVTHLQRYIACLEAKKGAQKSVGGEEGTHFGVRKMEFHSKYSYFLCLALLRTTLMLFYLYVVRPTF